LAAACSIEKAQQFFSYPTRARESPPPPCRYAGAAAGSAVHQVLYISHQVPSPVSTTAPQQASAAVAAMGKLKSGSGFSRFSSATSSTRRGLVRPCLEEATVEATATTAPSYVCITEDADDDGGETLVTISACKDSL
jgi:hypothetical protein